MLKTLVWATDGSAAADRALPCLRSLAGARGARVVAMHCVEFVIGPHVAGLPAHFDQTELTAKIERQVAQLRADGIDARLEILGNPGDGAARTIAQAACDVGADLIVVGTRGHSPAVELLLGSVTQRLLHIAHCPVVVVPPGAEPAA
jgi:nucleotide-binding universal stress UspA family protein